MIIPFLWKSRFCRCKFCVHEVYISVCCMKILCSCCEFIVKMHLNSCTSHLEMTLVMNIYRDLLQWSF